MKIEDFNNKVNEGFAAIYLFFKIYEANDLELINKLKELK